MKKKFIYVGVLCLWATKSLAQLNVQLHYDLGHGMYGKMCIRDSLPPLSCLVGPVQAMCTKIKQATVSYFSFFSFLLIRLVEM